LSPLGFRRAVARYLPRSLHPLVRRGAGIATSLWARSRIGWGVDPLSRSWGADRGLPVHRYYIDSFLDNRRTDIRGRCLEFQDSHYTRRFGDDRVTRSDVLHKDSGNPEATIVADLMLDNSLTADSFDCVVCTHVLHVIPDPGRAVSELFRILRPGGVLLLAVPGISMCDQSCGELWRFTPGGIRTLLANQFGEMVEVRSYGNSLTAACELRGVVAEELLGSELDFVDDAYPVEVCARAVKQVTVA
jgi:hypothetical protein